jgi:exopolysaccharide production protein ExoZ
MAANIKNIDVQLESVQALRAIAAICIMFFHIPWFSLIADQEDTSLLPRGVIAVDLFFVISGFIITWVSIIIRREDILSFCIKRSFRVIPAYWFWTVAIFILGGCMEVPKLASSLAFWPNAAIDAPYYGYPILPVGWSLNFEILFYTIFALSLLLGKYAVHGIISAILLQVFILPLALYGHITLDPTEITSPPSATISFLANPILLDFLIGIAIAYLYKYTETQLKICHFMLILTCTILSWAFSLYNFAPSPHPIIYGLPCGLLLLTLIIAEKLKIFTVPKWVIYLGDLSYSIYLIHEPIIAAVPMGHLILSQSFYLYFLYLVLILLCVLSGAHIFHIAFEKPMIML